MNTTFEAQNNQSLFERKEADNKLVTELQKGIDSGFVEDWDFNEWLKEVNQKYETKENTHR